jgi:hypothetical protein
VNIVVAFVFCCKETGDSARKQGRWWFGSGPLAILQWRHTMDYASNNYLCAIVFCAALMGIDMLRVPPDMNQMRRGGAFWSENDQV